MHSIVKSMMLSTVLQHIPPVRTLLVLLMVASMGCQSPKQERIIGVKIYEHQGSFDSLMRQWNSLGINTVFTSVELLSSASFRERAARYDLTTFFIFPVFYNPETLAEKPHWHAVTQYGDPATEEWVEFVCPSRTAYRESMVQYATEIVREYDPDGISIDFIRHFVFWEKVYPDHDPGTLPVTCFDPLCLTGFQEKNSITLPDSLISTEQKASWILDHHGEAWTRWKCGQITSMVKEIVEAVKEVKPDIRVNIHLVPWAGDDFDGAAERVAGQDVEALSSMADYLSPMTYAHMVKREPEWIHAIVEDIEARSSCRVLPSIQVNKAYLEHELTLAEFRESLEASLETPSAGVVFWSWERLAQDPDKLEQVKQILND